MQDSVLPRVQGCVAPAWGHGRAAPPPFTSHSPPSSPLIPLKNRPLAETVFEAFFGVCDCRGISVDCDDFSTVSAGVLVHPVAFVRLRYGL